jgi:hypothetical protein
MSLPSACISIVALLSISAFAETGSSRLEAEERVIQESFPSVVTLRGEPMPGIVELSTGVAVSPRHVVTLALFRPGSEPGFSDGEWLYYPDTAYFCPDLGLALLRFQEQLFEDFTLPSDRLPEAGESVSIVGQSISGLLEAGGLIAEQMPDGALVVSVAPRAGLMGAAAFDSSGDFVGLVKGVVTTQQNQFQQARADRLALLPSQLWSLWAEVMMFEQEYAGAAFGVTAVSYASTSSESPSGVLLVAVDREGRAWECGLRPGDVVVEVDGMGIHHPVTLMGLVITTATDLDLLVWRRGVSLDVVVDAQDPPE